MDRCQDQDLAGPAHLKEIRIDEEAMPETGNDVTGIPDVSAERIREAAALFDNEQRHRREWGSWTEDPNYRWALALDDKLYPVKEIIRRATGATNFSGGPQANAYLVGRGFSVIPLPEHGSSRSTAPIHLLLKWSRQHAGDTIEQHKRIADERGSVWWGIFGNRDRTPLSQNKIDRMRRQLAEAVPTSSFFYGGGAVWRADLLEVADDPDQVDGGLLPGYYSKNDCRLFVRVSDWRLSSTDELRTFALASAPDVPVSTGALSNQTNPLVLAALGDEQAEAPTPPGEIRAILEEILQGYGAARTVPFSGAHPIHAAFKALTDLVAASAPVRNRPHLRVKYSAGQGNWASVPWLALMDDRETSSTQRGVYCVYLFREDGSGVYLTLNQGVTDPQRTYGGAQGRAWLRDKAASMRVQLAGNVKRFRLDDRIDLRTERSLGSAYEASTAAHVLYERGTVPSDQLLLQDLEEVLTAYDDVRVEVPTSTVGLATLQKQFSEGLDRAGVRFGSRHDVTVVPFLASLLTKPFVILTGLSGSGKTQIALKFGEWLGSERRLVVAVRPDWTGPEALFGYPDILQPPDNEGRQAWSVPEPLEFILRAARNPQEPYVLILDEMNLAHVERYFADFLSGSESREPQVPNLALEEGHWRQNRDEERIAIPRNLFVVGTVNVDETTYMFSPKVLDRANTLEFRVATEDLASLARPKVMEPAGPEILSTIMAVATDDEWQEVNANADSEPFADHLKEIHRRLSASGWEFGHRTYYEALRFAAIFNAMGKTDWRQALDVQVLQKILPRLHGSKKRIEPTLVVLARYCFALGEGDDLDPLNPPEDKTAVLPASFAKLVRMIGIARVNQFVSFTD